MYDKVTLSMNPPKDLVIGKLYQHGVYIGDTYRNELMPIGSDIADGLYTKTMYSVLRHNVYPMFFDDTQYMSWGAIRGAVSLPTDRISEAYANALKEHPKDPDITPDMNICLDIVPRKDKQHLMYSYKNLTFVDLQLFHAIGVSQDLKTIIWIGGRPGNVPDSNDPTWTRTTTRIFEIHPNNIMSQSAIHTMKSATGLRSYIEQHAGFNWAFYKSKPNHMLYSKPFNLRFFDKNSGKTVMTISFSNKR